MPALIPFNAGPSFAPSYTLDLYSVIGKLRRRFWLLVSVTLAAFTVLVVGISTMKPKYYAEGTIMLNSRESRVVSFQQVLASLPGDLEAVQSEAQVLGSRSLAGQVVDALNLVNRVEFNPSLGQNSPIGQAKRWVTEYSEGWLDLTPKPQSPEMIRGGAIDIFSRKLTVDPIGRSRAIRVSFRSDDPELTANVVNKTTEFYIENQIETKKRLTRQAKSFLMKEVVASRDQVKQADGAVADFRSRHDLHEATKDNLLLSQQVSGVTQQLDVVRRKREEAEARATQAVDPETLPEVVANQSIGRMKEQRTQLQALAIQAEANLGSQAARAVQLRKASEDVDRRIKQEVAKVASSLKVEAAVQRASEQRLTDLLTELKRELGQSYQAEVQMHALQSEADVTRTLHQSVRTRSEEVGVDEAILQPDAVVLSHAETPLDPSFPQPKLLMALAFILSTCVGSAVTLVAQRERGGMKSMDEVADAFQVRPLGLVPQLPRNVSASRYVLDRPNSAYAEAIRAVLATVIVARKKSLILLVASAVPGDGKTITALALARLSAQMDQRTLLVDGDLRRPSVHQRLSQRNTVGLLDYLDGRASEPEIVQTDPATGLSVVFAGSSNTDTVQLLSSPRLHDVITKWRTMYDLVVFDSSPTASVVDAKLLAVCCDQVLFVARWNRTRRNLITAEIERLKEAGAQFAGLVLTQVDVGQHARDNYSDSGAFYASNYYKG